jgi:hypothetical protein
LVLLFGPWLAPTREYLPSIFGLAVAPLLDPKGLASSVSAAGSLLRSLLGLALGLCSILVPVSNFFGA